MVSEMQDNRSTKFIQLNLKDIPITLPTVLHRLDLPPTLDLYACCPACSALYPEEKAGSVPEFCTVKVGESACGQQLGSIQHRGATTWIKPARRYSHMLFETWLGEFLLRPGVEDMLEAARPNPKEPLTDLWDAPYLRSFPNQGGLAFFDAPPDELRLAMLLYHDFFNPFQNKTAGKIRSVGCFFMVCLNLPSDIRYDASNSYLVSVVPGPEETKMEDLNIFIRPIVENMLEIFNPGIWISKTHKHPQGRKVRAAIVIESMDTPAARGAGGFASHSHTCFCYLCTATRPAIDQPDLSRFKLRTIQAHRELVDLWMNADGKRRSKLYDQYGVRYTDWLRFPWWDPFSSMVVAPMHWTKNILDKQMRQNMEWSWTIPAGPPPDLSRPQPISELEYEWGHSAIMCLSESDFESAKLTAPLLRYLCWERNIYIAGLAGPRLVTELNKWRRDNNIISGGQIVPAVLKQYKGPPVSVARARYYISKHASQSVIATHAAVSDLVHLCQVLGLSDQGKKEILIQRLLDHYVRLDSI
ncbi:Transposase family Tnp2 protein [Ceratobasidium theobromae]|uniref:Transposase family Tnp2 protein n=1 Tax=Ceratobasidium theobromae TaxID=1582974 RepID=A0A5N5Q811_9AGAM|nr:Transposase family Tnp2 protein [Ceratobasidium theobromae]